MKRLSAFAVIFSICLILAACVPGSTSPPEQQTQEAGPGEISITSLPEQQTQEVGSGEISIGRPFQLRLGEQVSLADGGLSLKIVSVLSDTRCPAQVQCAEAGEATILFEAKMGDGSLKSVVLSDMPLRSTAIQGSYQFQLQGVQPYPQSLDERIPAKEYVATLQVDSIAPASQAELEEPFQLKVGEEAILSDEALRVRFSEVVSDSRCPSSVQCFHGGEARVIVEVRQGSTPPVVLELSTLPGESGAQAFDHWFELKKVDPYPKTPEQKITPEQYVITLVVGSSR